MRKASDEREGAIHIAPMNRSAKLRRKLMMKVMRVRRSFEGRTERNVVSLWEWVRQLGVTDSATINAGLCPLSETVLRAAREADHDLF